MREEQQPHSGIDPDPELCVIIPAFRAWSTLPAVLDALEPQIDRQRHEVTVVENSGDGSAARLDAWPWVRVVELPGRTLPGRARNLAVASTAARTLLFLDADSVPEQRWLERLTAASNGWDVVTGVVRNGTPRSATGTAQYFLEFSDWIPGTRIAPMHGATCNLLMRREALVDAGGFPEDLWPGEDTVVTVPFGLDGRLGFAPDASVHHMNRIGMREFLRHQRRLGQAYVQVCRRADFPHRRFGQPVMAPLAVMLRLAALAIRLAGSPRLAARAATVSPWIFAGAIAWGVGVARPETNPGSF